MRSDCRRLGIVAAGIASLSAFALPGCSERTVAEAAAESPSEAAVWNMSGADRDSTRETRLAAVMDVGNGVYVFPRTFFPQTLSDFRDAHPDREIISISQGWDSPGGSYGSQSGMVCNFIVVTSTPQTPQ